jgi:hypothetical protein
MSLIKSGTKEKEPPPVIIAVDGLPIEEVIQC